MYRERATRNRNGKGRKQSYSAEYKEAMKQEKTVVTRETYSNNNCKQEEKKKNTEN